jgi:hypothetical protein
MLCLFVFLAGHFKPLFKYSLMYYCHTKENIFVDGSCSFILVTTKDGVQLKFMETVTSVK